MKRIPPFRASKRSVPSASEKGAVLVITLVLMLMASLLAVYMAASSNQSLAVTRNVQTSITAFEAAEGAIQTLLMVSATSNTQQDPLRRLGAVGVEFDPFVQFPPANHPLANLPGGVAAYQLRVAPTAVEVDCPAMDESSAISNDLVTCTHYRVRSRHVAPNQRARVEVNQGVMRQFAK